MRHSLQNFLSVLLLSLALIAAGCAGQQTTTPPADEQPKTAPAMQVPKEATPATQAAVTTPATATSPAPASKAAESASASKTAASPQAATQQITPEGQIVYAWHTAISPQWFDPQEYPAFITPYAYAYAMHDALVKHMPGKPISPSLAESYEIADDFRSATFTLREGITFHNGEPVTPEDVIFTFENYKGANAQILHDKTEKVEKIDERTVKFTFTEPFLDFEVIYGTPASGAGWVVPKKYYEDVGPDGFKQHPIGAGPYKFVSQTPGNEIVLEAFMDYWRHPPHIKTLIIRGVAEPATRVAGLQTGEYDFINLVPGQLIPTVQQDPYLQLAPTFAAPFWLEMLGFENADSPFSDKRVRQAVSLALDREALSEAETAGFSRNEGNWIPEDWPGAIDLPEKQYGPEQAQQLLADAGYPDGFDVEALTPLPPYFSLGERVISQLRAVGIRIGRLNQMERGAFFSLVGEASDDVFPPGFVLNVSGAPGDAAARVRLYGTCNGASSRTCVPEIDEMFQQYEASSDPREREQLIADIQRYMDENFILVPVYRLAFVNAQGPRIANQWDQIIAAVPQYVYVGPYEDVQLKE